MNLIRVFLLLTLSPICASAHAETPVAKPSEIEIRAWIKQLGNEDFEARDLAEKKLIGAGEAARLELNTAAKNIDQEVMIRAKRLIARIDVAGVLEKMATARKNLHLFEGELKSTGPGIDQKIHSKTDYKQHRYHIDTIIGAGIGVMTLKLVSDGKVEWSTYLPATSGEEPTLKISKTDVSAKPRALGVLEYLEEKYGLFDFIGAVSEKIDDQEFYVISGVGNPDKHPRNDNDFTRFTSRLYVDKSTALPVKFEIFNERHQKKETVELSNVNLAPKFTAADFEYTPPAGAKVTEKKTVDED
jgi:outer membrane lipoprotein-sorting protein